MPIKRPRGRPPISAKRKYEAMISVAPSSRVQTHAVHYFEPAPHNSSIESSKLNASVFESDKVTADGVTKKVVSVLMTDGPLNLADLARAIPETSKESIQSIVDVLQVLGIVVKLLSKDGGKSTAFSITSWTRGAEAVEFSKVQEDAEKRLSNLVSVQKRILILQDLSNDPELSDDERTAKLKATLRSFVAEDPSLRKDRLFQSLMEQMEV